MRIKNFDLDDFGCFTRARLQDVNGGLTVIAGPQRAGKSTFMEAVRHLGYGVPRGKDLPPPTEQYDLTADVLVDGAEYQLSLTGYGEPTLTSLDGSPERTLQEVYSNLSATQYQQLFTISLDELRRVPTSLNGDVSLSAVLLGAAYGDVLEIPKIQEEFSETARQIGGKHGRAVYELKEPIQEIQSGVEEREAANAQVDEYNQKQDARSQVNERIEELDAEVEALQTERTRLNTVLAEYEEFETFQELTQELHDVDVDKIDSFPSERLDRVQQLQEQLEEADQEQTTAEEEFTEQVSVDDSEAYRDRLLDAQSTIRTYSREVAGWRERVKTLTEQQSELDSERRDLRSRAADLRPDWNEETVLDRVRDIETDLFARDEVRSVTNTYENIQSEYEDIERDLVEKETRKEQLAEDIETATDASSGTGNPIRNQLPIAGAGAVLALLAGSVVAVTAGAIPGVVVTLVVAFASSAYAASRIDWESPNVDGMSVETLRAEKRSVEADMEGLRSRKAELENERSSTGKKLETLRDDLGLPAETGPAAVREFYRDISGFQAELTTLEDDAEALKETETALRTELRDVAETLDDIGVLDTEGFDPLDDVKRLFAAVERAETDLDSAEAVVAAQRSVKTTKSELRDILSEWDDAPEVADAETDAIIRAADQFLERGEEVTDLVEAREQRDETHARLHRRLTASATAAAFESYRDSEDEADKWVLRAFERVVEEYADEEAIETRIETIDENIEDREDERSDCVERRVELTNELEELASDEDVREAHATIESGRRRLEPLAEDYATSRIAEYLLDELHERFIDRTTGPLLDEAGDIFARITDGTYTEIDSTNEFEDLDFESILADGQAQRTSELSRATAEQLFLAIRLARIRRHESSLPVLLDDSLTNFDPGHHIRTLQTISELADTNQVFLLTCHPELLDRVDAHTDTAQYWCLEDGRFDGPYSSPDEPSALLQPQRS
jgi:uncharacterized protein YhaN